MKKIFVYILIIVSLLLLISGCVKEVGICSNDFVIIDNNKTYLCERKDNNLNISASMIIKHKNNKGYKLIECA